MPDTPIDPFAAYRPLIAAVSAAIGFDLPKDTHIRFNQLQILHLRKENSRLAHLFDPASKVNWFNRLNSAVNEVRIGLTACHYHASSVFELEKLASTAALNVMPKIDMKSGSTLSAGNSNKLDFEYHAFIFAARRTLEYLSVMTATFFRTDCHRIGKLEDAIKKTKRDYKTSERLARRINLAVPLITGAAELKEGARTVRDRLAHWENIPSGAINMYRTGDEYRFQLLGGGENLSHKHVKEVKIGPGKFAKLVLGPRLIAKVGLLEWLIFGVAWDLGFLESPKLGNRSANAHYANIPEKLDI